LKIVKKLILSLVAISFLTTSSDITLPEILRGSLPFMLCMVLAIVILCIFPQIATWLPNYLLGS